MMKNLIAVVGTTGVGKTKLSVELARKFDGEVINGDSMQLYKGLDVLTNKVSESETQGVPHHLMSFLDIKERNNYGTLDFRADAVNIINKLHVGGTLPILAGGTHYFLNEILFDNVRISGHEMKTTTLAQKSRDGVDYGMLDTATTKELYIKLQDIDPQMAAKWHPNDRRKIRRSLEIYLQTGEKASSHYLKQQTQADLMPRARYKTCIMWLWAQPEILEMRLKERISQMFERGLIQELEQLHEEYEREESSGIPVDLERGIWQVIGYKEFKPWLESRSRDCSNPLYAECLKRMHIRTRQYANSQIKWIRRQILPLVQLSQKEPVHEVRICFLNATNAECWEAEVRDKAFEFLDSFLKRNPHPQESDPLAQKMLQPPTQASFARHVDQWESFQCPICTYKETLEPVTLVGRESWENHLVSRKHKKQLRLRRDNDQTPRG